MTPEEIRAARIETLRAKLKAREGRPGLEANVAAIRKQIAELEAGVDYQHSDTGQFVSVEFAIQNPETAVPVESAE